MNAKALLASNDSKIREMLQDAAVRENLDAVTCGDGREVMESVQEKLQELANLRLIVLDSLMPKTDGFEVVRLLQDVPEIKEVPVLMLLERGGGPLQPKLRIRLNADDYLEKPFDSAEVQQKVHSMVKYYRAHKGLHPVTGLGGHPQLEQEIITRLSRGESFSTVWLDINHFRPFNDHYGRDKGNEVIKQAGELIQKTIKGLELKEAVQAAHVDGDDFILLVPNESAQKCVKDLQGQFQSQITKFYSPEEKKQGFIYEKGRNQKNEIFPLMSLSAVVVNVTVEKFLHYGQLVCHANDLLHQAKVGN